MAARYLMAGPSMWAGTSTTRWTTKDGAVLHSAGDSGDLVFVRGAGFWDRAIQRFTDGLYNHVAIIVAPGRIVEAVRPRVQEIANPYQQATVLRVPYACALDRARAVTIARSYVGKSYSLASLVSDLAVWAGSPIDFDQTSALNCAELAALCVGLGLDPRGISPNALYSQIVRMPHA